jgi:homoserine kinase
MGPGLDIFGCAVTGPGDAVIAERTDDVQVRVVDAGHSELPQHPSRNSAAIAAAAVLRRAGSPRYGIALWVEKGLPLAAGQGGSAASAVAGAVAANALLDVALPHCALLEACLEAESAVAGHHADNVAPALMGGWVLIRSMKPLDVIRLPVPDALRIVLVHPNQRLRTADSRAVLPASVSREIALHQAAQVAAMAAALAANDLALLGRALDDRIAEPVRAALVPGFTEAKQAAMRAGALGGSLSGSGPTSFALTDGDDVAARVADAMRDAHRRLGIECRVRIERVDGQGARVSDA